MWCESPGRSYAGSLELGPAALCLDGTVEGKREVHEVPYAELSNVHMAAASDRLEGHPTLVIEAGPERRFQISSVAGLGVLREVADVLVMAMSGL